MKWIVIFLLINTSLYGQLRKDYQDHFVAGTFCGFAGYTLAMHTKTPVLYGIGTGIVIGGLKELYDIKHGTPEWQDFGYTVLGATVSSLLLNKIVKYGRNFEYGSSRVDILTVRNPVLFYRQEH